jgi:hypothetical protein
MTRSLVLKKETLCELGTDELQSVGGGVTPTSNNIGCLVSLVLPRCITDLCY